MLSERISRRNFFKVLGVGAGTTAAGLLTKETINVSLYPEIETTEAIFLPIYEEHFHGFEAEQLNNIDMLCLEVVGADASTIPGEEVSAYTAHWVSLLRPNQSVKKELIQKKIPLLVADVTLTSEQLRTSINLSVTEMLTGVIMLISQTILALSEKNKLKEKATLSITEPVKHHRRNFLKIVSALLGTWGATNLAATFLLPPMSKTLYSDTSTAVEKTLSRILIRLRGMMSNLHPEQLIAFFRNVIVAYKLKNLAKNVLAETGQKPRIGVAVGEGHSGIEDFLELDENILWQILSLFPASVFQTSIDVNEGLENFCGVRMVVLESQAPPSTDNILRNTDFEQKMLDKLNS